MQAVLNAALPVFALIAVGYAAARLRLLGGEATTNLNLFVVYVALPALLFQVTAEARWADLADLPFIAGYGGGLAATFVVAYAWERWAGRAPRATASLRALSAAYPNTGYMGIPLCLAALGAQSLPLVVVATILVVSVLFGAALALVEMERGDGAGAWRTAGKVSVALIRNPMLSAPAAGLAYAATTLPMPEPAMRTIALLGAAASPCALVTIGLFLAQTRGAGRAPDVARIVALKLLLQPAVTALLVYRVFDLPDLARHIALLLAATPTGTGPFMLAKLYDREAEAVARVILVSTLGSVLTISAVLLLIQR